MKRNSKGFLFLHPIIKMNNNFSDCPCGTGKHYSECCQNTHNSPAFVKTAEELMRSRFTAFTMANGPYLIETHHSTTRHIVDEKDLELWAKSVEWLRLEIIHTSNGKSSNDSGTVEFKAHFMEKGKASYIHEHSYFEKEFGDWKYKGIV